LPFHGLSKWEKKELNQADVRAIINGILQQVGNTDYTLVGHSFGARLILCTMPDFEHTPKQVILLAPAGIGNYDKVIPLWLQCLAERTLQRTNWLRFFVNMGGRLGLISNFHQRYAEVQLYPPAQRYRLFRIFNSLLDFPTDTTRVKSFWHETTIACLVVVAQQDRFVSSEKIKRFFEPMPKIEMLEVTGSHHLVNERIAMLVNKNIT